MLGAECWLAGWLVIGLLVVVGEWWLVTITHQLTSSSSHLPTRHPLTTTHHPPPTTHHPPTTNHQLPTTNYQPLKASHHSEAAVVLHERMVKPAIDAVLASQADRRCPRPVQALLAVCVHAWPQPTTTACNHSLQPQSATTACNHSLQPQPATTACNHNFQLPSMTSTNIPSFVGHRTSPPQHYDTQQPFLSSTSSKEQPRPHPASPTP